MKKLMHITTIFPIVSISNFEITKWSKYVYDCAKGKGQDATINPYADEDYSYALIENIGLVELKLENQLQTILNNFYLKPSNKCNKTLK